MAENIVMTLVEVLTVLTLAAKEWSGEFGIEAVGRRPDQLTDDEVRRTVEQTPQIFRGLSKNDNVKLVMDGMKA